MSFIMVALNRQSNKSQSSKIDIQAHILRRHKGNVLAPHKHCDMYIVQDQEYNKLRLS